MIWFYQRDGQQLYYEVRLRDDGPGFELGISHPGGTVLTERFDTEEALGARFLELQDSLRREGWGPLERRPTSASPDEPGLFRGTPYVC
jgi:hypothetical protein